MTHADVFLMLVKIYFLFGLFLLAAAVTQVEAKQIKYLGWAQAIAAAIIFVTFWPYPLVQVFANGAHKK